MRSSNQAGFTLIELLTIIGIVGVLSGLSISSFSLFRSKAAYSNAQITLREARNALEAGISDVSNPPAAVALVSQTSQGQVTDAAARALLPGFQVPRLMRFSVSYDPTCTNGACVSEFLEASHCYAEESTRWTRFGDGLDILVEHIAGGGC